MADGKEVGSAETPADWRNNRLVLESLRQATVVDRRPVPLRSEARAAARRPTDRPGRFVLRAPRGDDPRRGHSHQRQAGVSANGARSGFLPARASGPRRATRRCGTTSSCRRPLGFNGARLHQKVFEPRFLYWADKLGYIVWGEFPNWGLNYNKPNVQFAGRRRMDGDRPPRPQPSGHHRLVPVQRDVRRGRAASEGRRQRDAGRSIPRGR